MVSIVVFIKRFLSAADRHPMVTPGMKPAALRRVRKIGDHPRDKPQGVFFPQLGNRLEQSPRIGVQGLLKNIHGGTDFHDAPGIHHRHAVTDLGGYPKVMGDKKNGGALFLRHLLQKFEDVGLHGYIQSRCGFVGNQDFR